MAHEFTDGKKVETVYIVAGDQKVPELIRDEDAQNSLIKGIKKWMLSKSNDKATEIKDKWFQPNIVYD